MLWILPNFWYLHIFIFVWHFLLYLCPTRFSHKTFLNNLNSEAFEVSNQIAWHQLNLSCVFVVHLPINALLVRSHNVLLERVQSNQKLAPHLGHNNNNNSSHVAWRLCNIVILQFQRRHNVEAIFCKNFIARRNSAFENFQYLGPNIWRDARSKGQ